MQSRRSLIQTLAATTAGALVGTAPAPVQAQEYGEGEQFAPPWWLLAPLGENDRLEDGWVLKDLSPIRDGATVLTLSRRKESLRVHICLHDGSPKGLAFSELFDLIVMDHGRGVRRVPNDLSPTLLLLSDMIRENEWNDVPNHRLDGINRMMTHSERVRAFGPSHLQ